MPRLAIKVDVDTDRGTRDGVLPLARLLQKHNVPATFLFSLGPDNMGKSIFRIFQPGFFKKVMRTRVASQLGKRALLNGTLLPAPHLGRLHGALMREVRDVGFEVGVHCYDHYHWQNHLRRMSLEQTRDEFKKAAIEFERVFGERPQTAGAPGWQCTVHSLQAYDDYGLRYASDARGVHPFIPRMDGQQFTTLQWPTTLPTLDELLGRPEFFEDHLVDHYLTLIQSGPADHVMTMHAELEGLHYLGFLDSLLARLRAAGVTFFSLREAAVKLRNVDAPPLPVNDIRLQKIDGRSGTLAVQLAREGTP